MRRVSLLAVGLVLLTALAAYGQTVQNPREVTFTPSADHAVVDAYVIGFFPPGATSPVQEINLGKPTPDATNTCTATINTQPLPFGAAYIAKVRALAGTLSSVWSDASNPFDRVPGPPSKPAIK